MFSYDQRDWAQAASILRKHLRGLRQGKSPDDPIGQAALEDFAELFILREEGFSQSRKLKNKTLQDITAAAYICNGAVSRLRKVRHYSVADLEYTCYLAMFPEQDESYFPHYERLEEFARAVERSHREIQKSLEYHPIPLTYLRQAERLVGKRSTLREKGLAA